MFNIPFKEGAFHILLMISMAFVMCGSLRVSFMLFAWYINQLPFSVNWGSLQLIVKQLGWDSVSELVLNGKT